MAGHPFKEIVCDACGRIHKTLSMPSKYKNINPPISINFDEKLYVCTRCEKPICESCTLDAVWYGIIPFISENDHPLCEKCFEFAEVNYIKNIPQKYLPLYVNESWISEGGKRQFLERFKEPIAGDVA